MSQDTRFKPGQSGNPRGRPKLRRPHVSAFEIILDKRMSVTVGGKERKLTVDEALQQQTLKDAFAGKAMAVRKVLKMIAKREAALAKKGHGSRKLLTIKAHYSSDNANEAMRLLGIADRDPGFGGERWMLNTWATQAALSRPGRKRFTAPEARNIGFFTFDAKTLQWPRGSRE